MRRILLTGKSGQVGWELQRTLAPLGEVVALDVQDVDFASPDAIREKVREIKPQILVNAAAYTAVDRAESEPDLAMKVNGVAPGVLAEEANRLDALLVHYSTDYVFDGTKNGPYTETDAPNPLSVYGRSKLAGDQAIQATGVPHYIFRTSWVYAARGQNFVRTMLRLGREQTALRIINDQVGAPTWAHFIAEATAQVLGQMIKNPDLMQDRTGIYNLTAAGAVSWFGFADAIFAEAKARLGMTPPKLIPITTAEYPLPARRPANSRLDTSKLTRVFGLTPAPWETVLTSCMRQLGDN
ncbi:MAG: dTDP-4-dehydrorhamnose reductase [Betaproteobacteria bacterium]|nr:dTDP-4-dehydrorhamnose reductase [Betaproteobacteria bacterium]MDH3436990.1 dTDP-4-dehydrorhamnose reductase [Betaproteobacteria bacterium]